MFSIIVAIINIGVNRTKRASIISRYTKNRLAICEKGTNLLNFDELAHFLLNISCMEPDADVKKIT